MSVKTAPASLARTLQALQERGFDLLHPFRWGWCLPHPKLDQKARRDSLAVLVANTRALWPRFQAARRALPHRDPLDHYTEKSVLEALALTREPHRIFWVHTVGEEGIPAQHIAEASGLSWNAPSFLSIHPHYGPWFGMRAVLLFPDLPGPDARPAPPSPCLACERACLPRFQEAMARSGEHVGSAEVAENWRLWVSVRDACPRGREHRYGDAQIRFHYGADA